MGLYERHVLPRLINLACSGRDVERQRQRVVPAATGRVLEVGMGPGLNLPFYDRSRVEHIWGLEPNDGMRARAAERIDASGLDVRWLGEPGESIPLDDDSVDTVVLTYTLCSIADWETALHEMRRVLRPGGRLLFCEHGAAPDQSVRRWQHRIDPAWTRVAGGCHLTRRIPELIERGGFRIDELDEGYVHAPKISGYQYWGTARPTP
jgi:ubiquinone/menaquinone biosynthesis C-methylase UbiE